MRCNKLKKFADLSTSHPESRGGAGTRTLDCPPAKTLAIRYTELQTKLRNKFEGKSKLDSPLDFQN